jgi:hypothetical protein
MDRTVSIFSTEKETTCEKIFFSICSICAFNELNLKNDDEVNNWMDKITHYLKSSYYQGEFNKFIKFVNFKIPEVITSFII